jgi:hypothetical protein
VRTEIGLAHEVTQRRGAPETAGAMNQFPHSAEAKRAGSGEQASGRGAKTMCCARSG